MTEHPDLSFHKHLISTGRIPTVLYKYTRINDEIVTSLGNSQLWFANPLTFNDPFDCQINDQTNWTSESLQQFITSSPIFNNELTRKFALSFPPQVFSEFFKSSLRETLAKIGVACFSQTNDNILLWSHYASAHTGVCIKFDITEDPDFFVWTLPMEYSDNYPIYDYVKNRNDLTDKIIMTKSNHWKYEREIRLLKKTSGLHKFNAKCLKEVTFGCRTSDSHIEKIKTGLDSATFPNLKFKKAVLKKTEFAVDIIDI